MISAAQRATVTREEAVPDVQETEREQIFQALERALFHPTEAGIQEALALCRVWLGQHPDDWAMRDAGEPVSLLADALEIIARESKA